MSEPGNNFSNAVKSGIADTEWPVSFSGSRKAYFSARDENLLQFSNLETAKRRAAFTRWKTLENLDKYLIQFEANFLKAGGKVIWAKDADEACSEIIGIINKSGATKIVKSKTLTGGEINLDDALTKNHKQWTETDLGQYVLQLANDQPSHMVNSALHKSHEFVQHLFSEKLGVATGGLDNAALSRAAAQRIRDENKKATIGITGANFLLAEPGAVAISENEGNVMMAATCRIHIVIAGIDKVIPSVSDLHVMWPLLANFSTGQKLTTYNSIINGPSRNGEMDGPSEMYVVLVDNGRTEVLAKEAQRNVLGCIKCGACLYADPVYSAIGGKWLNSTWMGPPGSVILPIIKGMKTHGFFNHLSTLSGADTEVCPVNINFNKLLLENRRDAVVEQATSKSEKIFYFLWKHASLKREIVNWKNIKTRKFILNNLFLKSPNDLRVMRTPAKESFNEMWRKLMNNG